MFITLCDITGGNIYPIPIVPPDTSIEEGGQNETVKTVQGDIRLTGNKVLTTVSWSSIFPVNKNYKFVSVGSFPNGYSYVNFILSAIEAKIPIRVVITTLQKRPILNKLMTIDEGFSYQLDKAGDIKYSIKLTEFPSDKWDFMNASPKMRAYLSTLAFQSVAKQALSKVGLL